MEDGDASVIVGELLGRDGIVWVLEGSVVWERGKVTVEMWLATYL